MGNAQSAAADRHDGPPFQRGTISVEDLCHQRNALRRRDIGKPHEPRVRQVVEVDQLTEIRIRGDQDAAFFRGPCQQRPVAGVGTEFASLDDIVPLVLQPCGQPPASAAVGQESQAGVTETRSSVSRAMTAWA